MTRALVWIFSTAICLGLAHADETPPWAPMPPSDVLGKPLGAIVEAKGAPAEGASDATHARYSESWFGLPVPVDADYLADGGESKAIQQITLNIPAELKRKDIIASVNKVLGKGEQGPSAEDAPSKYQAHWIRDEVRYDLQDFGDTIEMYILRARLDDPARYGLPENVRLIQAAFGNVVEDDDSEQVLLVGMAADDTTPFRDRLTLLVLDNGEKADIITPLPEAVGNGYGPGILVRDFTGDGLDDVFMRASTGGSGGIYNSAIYSYAGGKANLIFSTDSQTPPGFDGALQDGYKATLHVNAPEKKVELDLSGRKKQYDEAGVYADGKLLKPTELWGEVYGWLAPVDTDNDKVFELRVVQQVRATSNADRVAEIDSILKYENGAWAVIASDVKPLGN